MLKKKFKCGLVGGDRSAIWRIRGWSKRRQRVWIEFFVRIPGNFPATRVLFVGDVQHRKTMVTHANVGRTALR